MIRAHCDKCPAVADANEPISGLYALPDDWGRAREEGEWKHRCPLCKDTAIKRNPADTWVEGLPVMR